MPENAEVSDEKFRHRGVAPHRVSGATVAPMPTLAKRVTEALRARGLRKRDVDERVAVALGRAPRALNGLTSDVCGGTREPTASVLAAMARVLEVRAGWLLAGEGSMAEGAAATTYSALPGWADAAALEEARERLPAWAVRAAGRSPVLVQPGQVTAETVYAVASCWLATASDEAREAARRD